MAKGDLRDQLGSFLKGALNQLDTVREVVGQKARVGRIQLDLAMLKRRRKDALADLGEAVARLAAAGRISEEELPELGAPLAQLEALDEKIAAEEERARNAAAGAATSPPPHEEYYDEQDEEEDIEAEPGAPGAPKDDLDSGSKGG